jgi:hypothetical protein
LRELLPVPTWLAVGGLLTGISVIAIGRLALLLPAVYILVSIVDTLLIIYGLKANPWMHNVLHTKFSAQLPNDDGTFGPKAASKGVVVFMIGAKSNHPMGLLAPKFRKVGGYFQQMNHDIEIRKDEFGLIGLSAWTGLERGSSNDLMTLMYFKNYE